MKKVMLRATELLLLAFSCGCLIPPYSSTSEPPDLFPGLAFAVVAYAANLILAYRRDAETAVTVVLKLTGFALFGLIVFLRCVGP